MRVREWWRSKEEKVVFPVPGKFCTRVKRRIEYTPWVGERMLPLDEQGASSFWIRGQDEELHVNTTGEEDATRGSSCEMPWLFSGKLEFIVGISRNNKR